MIDELDRIIESVIVAGLPDDMEPTPTVTMAPPDSQFPPQGVTLPAIDLFLYDVRENRDLRTVEPIRQRIEDDGVDRFVITPAPVRMDCSYIVTAWPNPTAPNEAEDEHRLLGEVMRILLANHRLPVPAGSRWENDLPIRAVPAQEGRLQSAGEFWQALGGKAKASLDYRVTISVDVAAPPIEAQTVLETVVKLAQIREPETKENNA